MLIHSRRPPKSKRSWRRDLEVASKGYQAGVRRPGGTKFQAQRTRSFAGVHNVSGGAGLSEDQADRKSATACELATGSKGVRTQTSRSTEGACPGHPLSVVLVVTINISPLRGFELYGSSAISPWKTSRLCCRRCRDAVSISPRRDRNPREQR